MRPNNLALALRDPALGAAVGALSGADFGADPRRSPQFGTHSFGFGADAGTPTAADYHAAMQAQQATQKRTLLLHPNRDSDMAIMRFSWGIQETLTLSTADPGLLLSGNPEVDFRPQRVTSNVPLPGMCTVDSLKAANVDAIVGGEVDAFIWSALAQGAEVDFPTLTPANTMKATGAYSGLLPDGGYVTATPFVYIISFTGPAGLTP
jgi:hypothetical protein